MLTRALHAITDAASSRRGKFVTMIVWLIVAIVLVVVAPKLSSIYNNTVTQSIPADANSQQAQQMLLKEFPSSRGTPAILVFYDKNGLSSSDNVHAKQMSDWLTSSAKPADVGAVLSVFTVPQAASQLISKDKTTMTMVVTLNGSTTDATFQDNIKQMRDHLQSVVAGTSLQAHVTGPAGVVADAGLIFASTDIKLLLATVGLVLILLIALYRSPILAFLPLIAVGWALQIVDALLGFAGQANIFGVSQQASSIMTVLLFGAGTDYSIFIASRFREELMHTQDKHLAMRNTMRAVGEAITSSAGTVLLALLTLIFAAIGLYSSLGPTLAVAIFVMLLAGLTLVPALLVWIGRAAYWPMIPRYQEGITTEEAQRSATPRGFWGRLGVWTAKHRVLAAASSLLLLVVLALGNIGSQPTFNFLTAFRDPTDSSNGYAILQQHFPAGTLAPTAIILKLGGKTADAYQHLAQLDAVTVALQKVPGVATVQGPTRPDGNAPIVDPNTLQTALATLPAQVKDAIRSGKQLPTCSGPACPPSNPQQALVIGAYAASTTYVSPDNTTVQLSVVLKDDPYSLTAINRIAPLRDALNKALSDNGLGTQSATSATPYIAGQTSLLADTLQYNQRDTFLIVPIVLLLVGIVLGLLLRSLIAPLYLLSAVTLNFLAAIGICSFFFQHIQGQDGFSYAIPLYTFIFLVALGADYTIFLMSRVREEAQRHGLEKGVPIAVSHTGGVITSAGLILAGTFAVLTSLPLNILYQFGICVAVGILMDTFIVRGLLIPAIVLLLGKWNWWPGHLLESHNIQEPEQARATSGVAE
ncbi:MAG TPA: MMPL family transporter [Ktedonobacteraceae bacterium]|nr:MMPL family transporter [Ktedonobacteraceae bacterium]